MKTEELTALGVPEELAPKILAINGKDIEHAKAAVTTAKDKEIATLTTERDGLQEQLNTANDTLKKFEGIDPEQIQTELNTYKTRAEEAAQKLVNGLMARDQRDWIKDKLDEYGVKSPLARRQITADVMAAESGLKWNPGKDGKPGAYYGFDDYMKAAKEEDPTLYQTAEEKAEAEKQTALEEKAPKFTGPTGNEGGDQNGAKYVPPVVF